MAKLSRLAFGLVLEPLRPISFFKISSRRMICPLNGFTLGRPALEPALKHGLPFLLQVCLALYLSHQASGEHSLYLLEQLLTESTLPNLLVDYVLQNQVGERAAHHATEVVLRKKLYF